MSFNIFTLLSKGIDKVTGTIRSYGIFKSLIVGFLFFALVNGVVGTYEAINPAPIRPAPVVVLNRPEAVAEAPKAIEKRDRLNSYYKLEECNIVIGDVMDIPASEIVFVKKDFADGKTYYTFKRVQPNYTTEYLCTENMGDLMAMWGIKYPGEKVSYSKWHNLNTEQF